MSKMSQLHAELSEQAAELGYPNIESAEASGYEVVYTGESAKLVNFEKEMEEAHKVWLEEKQDLLDEMRDILPQIIEDAKSGNFDANRVMLVLERAIKFIEEGEM